MKVKELINLLEQCDQNLDVIVTNYSNNDTFVDDVENVFEIEIAQYSTHDEFIDAYMVRNDKVSWNNTKRVVHILMRPCITNTHEKYIRNKYTLKD